MYPESNDLNDYLVSDAIIDCQGRRFPFAVRNTGVGV